MSQSRANPSALAERKFFSDIVRSILSASSPQANVKMGNENYTIAVARMLNINAAAVSFSQLK